MKTTIAILFVSIAASAGPLGEQTRQYTRNPYAEKAVVQGVMTLGDLSIFGATASLIVKLRPDFEKMTSLQSKVARYDGESQALEGILRRVQTGDLTVIDNNARSRLLSDADQVLENLIREQKDVRGALSVTESTPVAATNREARFKAVARVNELNGMIESQKGHIKALQNLSLAANASVAETAIQAKLSVAQIERNLAEMELKTLKGNIVTRFGKGTVRVFAGVTGLIFLADAGTRFYMILIESADPGLFPVVEVAADAADANRPLLREIKRALQQLGSSASSTIDSITNNQ